MQTQLSRKNPVNGLINSFFDDAFFAPRQRSGRLSNGAGWVPPVDLSQTENNFVLRADLPGLQRDDIEITVEDRTLTLTGSRSFEDRTATDAPKTEGADDDKSVEDQAVQADGETFTRIERSFGSFSRTFHLPTNVDTSKIQASFTDGVLTLLIAKSEQAKSRRIEIS